MSLSFWKTRVRENRTIIGYVAGGTALGVVLAASGLALDMKLRAWQGIDASLGATFSATLMHSIALLSPLVMGRAFLSLGRRRRAVDERLRQQDEAEAMMRHKARIDSVTGLFNRAYLVELLEEGIATREWARHGALLYMLDLDDFKGINDTLGHRAGDVVLQTVGARLRAAAGPADIAVRLGGDEFVVVHFPAGDEVFPHLFAERLLRVVSETIRFEHSNVQPGVSIGIARVGHDGNTWSDMIRAADTALYRAKQETGSAYRLLDEELREETERQRILESELRAGLDRGEIEVHYQPIHGTGSGALRSFEALARWRHPARGIVPPMEFVPLAEANGLIVRLGRTVLREACRTAAGWPKPIGVSVNLSPVQFKDPELAETIEAALRDSGLAPGRLDLEVPEALLLEPSPRVCAVLDRLRALGVRVTMDDFGASFAGLAGLRAPRFDRVKIDREFTRVLGGADDGEVARSIVNLSRTLRVETVLEGVETPEQLRFARAEGLSEIQGFLYARPMTEAEAAEHIARLRSGPEERAEAVA